MTQALREYLTKKLATERSAVDRYNKLYDAATPLGYIDPEVRKMYGNRVTPVNINLARLAVDTVVQRLLVTGFRSGDDVVDNGITELWRSLSMPTLSSLAHVEALVSGRAFLLVWNVNGAPVITVESPTQMTVTRDPVTGVIIGALKRYRDSEGNTRSVVMTADTIDTYVSRESFAPDPTYTTTPSVMGEDMALASSEINPYGRVTVTCLPNRPRITTPDGTSDLCDLEDPLTAISKLASDMMTASEAAAIPRRYLTTPALINEEQAREVQRTMSGTLASPGGTRTAIVGGGAELHEFSTSDLQNFDTAIRLLVSQVAAIASLPPYYVSGETSSPTSADAVRASEGRITAKALERQRWWGPAYADAMRLAVLVRDGVEDPRLSTLATLWADPAPASVAQQADATTKLLAGAVIDRRAALESLGLDPLEVERILATPPITAA